MRINVKRLKQLIKEEINKQILTEQVATDIPSWYSLGGGAPGEDFYVRPSINSTRGPGTTFGRSGGGDPYYDSPERLEYIPTADPESRSLATRAMAPLAAMGRLSLNGGESIYPLRELTMLLREHRNEFVNIKALYESIVNYLRTNPAPRYEELNNMISTAVSSNFRGYQFSRNARVSELFNFRNVLTQVMGSQATLGGVVSYVRSHSPGLFEAYDTAYRLAYSFERLLDSIPTSARAGYVRAGMSEPEYTNQILRERKEGLLRLLGELIRRLDVLLRVTDTTVATLQRDVATGTAMASAASTGRARGSAAG